MITGGWFGGYAEKYVEVLRSDGIPWCSLPDLSDYRAYHTQSGLIACGGQNTKSSCITFREGKWVHSHNLTLPRQKHSSWLSEHHGTIILGGEDSTAQKSTEILTVNGDSQNGFSLNYYTR